MVLADTEVEDNLLYIEQIEQWIDANRHMLDREHGDSNPFATMTGVKPSGALTTDELEACLALHQS